jgi:DNA-binding XRE family transcriptional regulator
MTSTEFAAIRQSLGLTQVELAEIMGVEKQTINRIERGRQPTRVQAAFVKYISRHHKYS